jgi:diguanylate cyclase (GGDEF)-like protein/PAS domain S-box-containing protein
MTPMKKISDNQSTQENLLEEFNHLRARVFELENAQAADHEQMEALRESEARYRILLDESSDPIFAFYPDGTYRCVNNAFAEGVGRKMADITGKKIWDVFPKDEAEMRFATVRWVLENGQTRVIEVRVPRPDGDRYYITTVRPVFDEQGKAVVSVMCISKEITERKRMEQELQYLSTHDILTGLYNRNFFEVELERIQPGRHFPVSIVIADMDNLKAINDTFGHVAGDELLRMLAMEFRRSFRAEDIVARIGGDEFGVLLPETREDAANAVVNRLRANLAMEKDSHLKVSIGVATAGEGDRLAEVMRLADDRMYQDKASHRAEIEARRNSPQI